MAKNTKATEVELETDEIESAVEDTSVEVSLKTEGIATPIEVPAEPVQVRKKVNLGMTRASAGFFK